LLASIAVATVVAGVCPVTAAEPALASPWAVEESVRMRLVAGGVDKPGGARELYAGLEIQLADGWKTYWRNPGSSGVPPRVETTGSENVAGAELMFPAPHRIKDRDGDTIGYKQQVVLPIRLTLADPARPATLKVAAEIGICRDVCIPVQPTLSLAIPAEAATRPASAPLTEALARVPAARKDARDPSVKSIAVELAAPEPRIVIEASFPGDPAKGDVFLEAPDGLWIPMAQAKGAPAEAASGNTRRFEVDLTDGADLADLKGKTIRLTLVGAKGQAETTFKLE
jgi:DsbC/DsbD-like thiol-disulfide interchange protein